MISRAQGVGEVTHRLKRYNPAMKSYVCYYGPEPKLSDEETQEQKEKRLARPLIVQFTKDPHWTLPAKEQAESERFILQRQGVFAGEHFCEFAVEELPDGKFAIFCPNHPGPTSRV
jgi:hypothetical protein